MKPNTRRYSRTHFALTTALFTLAIILPPGLARAQKIGSEEETAKILTIERLAVRGGEVSGMVRNKTSHPVRDVQLLIRYTWLWEDERKPGKVDPGTSAYHILKRTIEPGSKADFIFKPSPPLLQMSGGRFDTSVMISGFSEVIPQKK